jgi:peptidoglycan/xylan/chitin deacetylase (PgdA/CDA1 family)
MTSRMNPVISLWQKIERRLARICERQTVELKFDTGIVCFTFDDVHRSACVRGAEVLERYGLKGTFYVCGGLTGRDDFHTKADLRRLIRSGHELGCHGYAHQGYQSLSEAEMLADIQRNRSFFAELGCDAPRHFAYPYGDVSPSVKRIAAHEFISARGVQPGINHSAVDVALLKAFPLYQQLWTENAIGAWAEKNAALGGLLIFFTHQVRPDPDEFDCSTELLDFAVRASVESGNGVLTVEAALSKASERLSARAD